MIRTCAWTGEDFEGKGYVLTTTEGTEIVSEAAFMAPYRTAEPTDQAPADTSSETAADTEPADVTQMGDTAGTEGGTESVSGQK